MKHPYLYHYTWWKLGNSGRGQHNYLIWCTKTTIMCVYVQKMIDLTVRHVILWQCCFSLQFSPRLLLISLPLYLFMFLYNFLDLYFHMQVFQLAFFGSFMDLAFPCHLLAFTVLFNILASQYPTTNNNIFWVSFMTTSWMH